MRTPIIGRPRPLSRQRRADHLYTLNCEEPSTRPTGHLRHRGRTRDPLYGVRRTLRTRFPLLTARQRTRLEAVFADDNHLPVQLTWGVYQRIIAAYSHPDRRRGKTMMTAIINEPLCR
ncbi:MULTISPECIES: hypothetical protein [Mycobacterium simiae complex]|uniref:hypothetical protein n=1 Tax=Mycobacterium simiae complex TaxID=2249310 RepID=UPI003C6D8C02